MKKFKNNKILIATGGTGGHVFPALSLAKHFIKNQYLVEIVTDERGMRFLNKYPELKLTLIKSGTIFKKNIFKIIISFFVIIFSLLKSYHRVKLSLSGRKFFFHCNECLLGQLQKCMKSFLWP